MIEQGLGWKFRDHIKDHLLFEDQVCEHLITGHLAYRRVFPERLYKDEIALKAVQDQIAATAKIEHPSFQRYFLAGDSAGHFTVVGELTDVPSIRLIADRKQITKPLKWAQFALKLVRFCQEMERLAVALDRLNMDDLRFNRGMFRISARWPVGCLDDLAVNSSPYLQKLMDSPVGGAYCCKGHAYPMEGSLRRIKEFLFMLASGQTARDLQQTLDDRAERSRISGAKQFSVLGLETAIEDVLMRLHDPEDPKRITNFAALANALSAIAPEDLGPGTRSTVGVAFDPTQSGSATESSGFFGGSPEEESGRVPSSGGSKREVPSSEPGSARANREVPSSGNQDTGPTGRSSNIEMSSRERSKEDAEEDRSYLYPQVKRKAPQKKGVERQVGAPPPEPEKKPKADAGTGAPVLPGVSASAGRAPGPAPVRRKKNFKPVIFGILGLIGLGVAGAGGYYAWDIISVPAEPNQRPVASFVMAPETNAETGPEGVVIVQRDLGVVALDPTGSMDPENDDLTYEWTIPEIDSTDYQIQPDPVNAGTYDLKLFRISDGGTFNVTLRVFDGESYSDPVSQSIRVILPSV